MVGRSRPECEAGYTGAAAAGVTGVTERSIHRWTAARPHWGRRMASAGPAARCCGVSPQMRSTHAPSGAAVLDPTCDLRSTSSPYLISLFFLSFPFSFGSSTEPRFNFHPRGGGERRRARRVLARHPDLRAMTGARRLIIRGAGVPTRKGNARLAALHRGCFAVSARASRCPGFPPGSSGNLVCRPGHMPGGPGRLSLPAVRPMNKPGRGRHLPRPA